MSIVKRSILSFSVLLILPGQVASALESPLLQKTPQGTIDWNGRFIESVGMGVAPAGKENTAQGKLLAQRAAVADAYRQLAETVNGVQVDAQTTVKDYVVQSDLIRTRVTATIRGAKQVGEPKQNNDGSVAITLRLPIYGHQQLSGAIQLNQRLRQTSQPQRLQVNRFGYSLAQLQTQSQLSQLPLRPQRLASAGFIPLQLAQNTGFTGLVLDMCTAPLQPAMSPAVFGADQQVYIGNYPIDPDQVVNQGVLQYFDNFGAALESPRVGSNPLVIEALGAHANQTDILVSPEDAQRILEADAAGQFLQALKVVVASF